MLKISVNEFTEIRKEFDAMVGKLDTIRKQLERSVMDNPASKSADLSQVRLSLEERKKCFAAC